MAVPEVALQLCILEDDPGIATLERVALQRQGYLVHVCHTADHALALADDGAIDCWLIDHELSGALNGLQVVAELRQRGAQEPAVLVTGNADPEVLLTALRAGVQDYVLKGEGFLQLLVPRIAAVIATARAQRQAQLSATRAELETERRRELEAENAERRRAEARAHAAMARLQEADRRKDEFLAMLGHELRNPLAPIASAVEVLRANPEDAERAVWAADIIGRQVDQLRYLVDDLLDVARIMNGHLVLRCAATDLRGVVQQALERASPQIESRGHRLVCDIGEEAIVVNGDAVRLIQIVANIIDNAAKYTAPNGRIEVILRRIDGKAELHVKDSGVGIAKKDLDDLFSLFVQGEQTPDRPEGGLGLGLALVKRLVTLHKGSIEASSEGPGHGSCFFLTLPLGEESAVPLTKEGPDLPQAPERRVLVVDDNVDAASAMAMLMKIWGFETTTAVDGLGALEAVAKDDPDVVMLDIGLPGIDGYGVIKAAKEQSARERLWIAVTGYGQEADRQRAMAAGFDAHLTKPVKAESLREVLAPLLRKIEPAE